MGRLRMFAVLADALGAAVVVDLPALAAIGALFGAGASAKLVPVGFGFFALWGIAFSCRDVTGGFSRKALGLRLETVDGGHPGLWRSLARNAPLLVPGWNLYEASRVQKGLMRSVDAALRLRFRDEP